MAENETHRFELAQVNVGRLVAPLDDPRLADFMAALDPVNALADAAPGFVWRLQTDEGNATAVEAFTWDAGDSAGVIINMSVWRDLESCGPSSPPDCTGPCCDGAGPGSSRWPRRRSPAGGCRPGTAPRRSRPKSRVRHLRAHGPTEHAFTLRTGFPSPVE